MAGVMAIFQSTPVGTSGWRQTAFAVGTCVLLVGAVAVCYVQSLSAPFFFDDEPAIVGNGTIRSLGVEAWFPPADGAGVTGRPLTNFTLALNYAFGGLEVRGYRWVNLILHAAVALLLWRVLWHAMGLAGVPRRWQARRELIAAGVPLLWAVHPLASAAVMFVVQRNEQMAAFFYLLLAYCFLRGVGSGGPIAQRGWLAAGVVAMGAGVLSKEVMATAPLLVLLADRTFFAGSFRAAWRARRAFYVGLAAMEGVLAWLMVAAEQRAGAVGLGLGMGTWEYLLTQAGAVAWYLRLCFWPDPLVADYGTPVVTSLGAVGWQAAGLVALLGSGCWLVWSRRSIWGFLIVTFFVILAPSSSFVPLTTQTMAEHRMYLPLAVVMVGAGGGLLALLPGRWGLGLVGLGAAGLAWGTVARTQDYRDARTIWSDTVAKAPENARAHLNLGRVLHEAGARGEAERCFRRSIELRPDSVEAHYNLGLVLTQTGRGGEAIGHFEHALRIEPGYGPARSDLAGVLLASGRPEAALREMLLAVAAQPGRPDFRVNLGNVYSTLGRSREAEEAYREAVRLGPRDPVALQVLGQWLLAANRPAEAAPVLETLVQLRPEKADGWAALGRAQLLSGRREEAVAACARAVAAEPTSAELRLAHALALAAAGRLDEAIVAAEAALALKPDFPAASAYLEKMRADRRRDRR